MPLNGISSSLYLTIPEEGYFTNLAAKQIQYYIFIVAASSGYSSIYLNIQGRGYLKNLAAQWVPGIYNDDMAFLLVLASGFTLLAVVLKEHRFKP